jgi:hypothetical protein
MLSLGHPAPHDELAAKIEEQSDGGIEDAAVYPVVSSQYPQVHEDGE